MNLASSRMSKKATVVSVCEWNRKELLVELSISALMFRRSPPMRRTQHMRLRMSSHWGRRAVSPWRKGFQKVGSRGDPHVECCWRVEWMKNERWGTGESEEEVFWGALLERETEKWDAFCGDHLRSREFFCLLVYFIRWSVLQCVFVCSEEENISNSGITCLLCS